MPVNPNTGLYEREPASITPPGIFDTALEGMNSVRATSLSQEAQQRNQLENLLLGLSAQRQQKQENRMDQYIREMQGITNPVPPRAPEPGEQGPGFGYASSQDEAPSRPPSYDEMIQRGSIIAMQTGQAAAPAYVRAATAADALSAKSGYWDAKAEESRRRAANVDRLADSLIQTRSARVASDNARNAIQSAHIALLQMEDWEKQSGNDPNVQARIADVALRAQATLDAARQHIGVLTVEEGKAFGTNKQQIHQELEDRKRAFADEETTLSRYVSASSVPTYRPQGGPPKQTPLPGGGASATPSGAGSPTPGGPPPPPAPKGGPVGRAPGVADTNDWTAPDGKHYVVKNGLAYTP